MLAGPAQQACPTALEQQPNHSAPLTCIASSGGALHALQRMEKSERRCIMSRLPGARAVGRSGSSTAGVCLGPGASVSRFDAAAQPIQRSSDI